MHPNTVAYRVKRIEEITGLSLDTYRDRLSTQVALEILDALGDEAGVRRHDRIRRRCSAARLLVCDGAMGTMLHAAGCALDRALPEVNLSDPKLVGTIHESYVAAGADMIQTNTFGANRLWLAGHGCADQVEEINQAAVRIARDGRASAAGRPVFVAGAVSPAVTARLRRQVGAAERAEVLAEQVRALAAAGADLIILETFGYLDELAEAVTVASDGLRRCRIVAQATFAEDGRTLGGETPHEVASVLGELPVAMLGRQLHDRAAADARRGGEPGPVQPAAGQRAAERRAAAPGRRPPTSSSASTAATSPGTCAGSRRPERPWSAGAAAPPPRHIEAAVASWLSCGRAGPGRAGRPAPQPRRAPDAPGRPRGPWPPGWPAASSSSPPRSPPRTTAPLSQTTDTVIALRDQGVGLVAVTAPENPRAHRDSLGMALHLQQHAGVEAIVTMTTWDKTIMTLQADLLGAHALGIRNVICEAGQPAGARRLPGRGRGLGGRLARPGHAARGPERRPRPGWAAAEPRRPRSASGPGSTRARRTLAAEIARARAEVRAGAQFLVTRPVYELGALRRMAGALADTGVPLLMSVSPLRSFEEADYLAHEVPEVHIPAGTLRAHGAGGAGAARR